MAGGVSPSQGLMLGKTLRIPSTGTGRRGGSPAVLSPGFGGTVTPWDHGSAGCRGWLRSAGGCVGILSFPRLTEGGCVSARRGSLVERGGF